MSTPSPTATAAYVRAIRKFAVQTQDWATANRHYVLPDEVNDLTLIARRVYGDPSLYLVIFAAAGLDTLEQQVSAQLLVLPTASQLNAIKKQTGYLSDDEAAAYDSID